LSEKLHVAVLYGGRSAEHDVSIMSANNVLQAIDRTIYRPVPIGVARDGRWRLAEDNGKPLVSPDESAAPEVALLPGGRGGLVAGSPVGSLPLIDVVFPVLHGQFGEDGTVQGYAETAGVAYVGCGVLSSAIAMDKDVAKRLLTAAGIPMARSVTLLKGEEMPFSDITRQLGSPVFVKPARQGSSVGVGKAGDAASYFRAAEAAFQHDDKVLVEEFVEAREIECAVLETPDGSLIVSEPGEIVTATTHAFYTYEAKYLDPDGAVVRTPADVPVEISAAAMEMAAQAFRTLGCAGMARVDFFLRPDGTLMLNEVNTIPGFTNFSMYAKALGAKGITYQQVISTLIEHARARAAKTQRKAPANA
jgi:D-alanine-D-alanine ligase